MIRKFVWLFCILLTAWLIFNSYQKKSSTVAPDNAVKDAVHFEFIKKFKPFA